MSPVLGTALRTATSVLVMGALSYPFWGQLRTAGTPALLMVIAGGGVVAGAMGITFFYMAIASGNLSLVLPIAFCLTPVLGVVIGVVFLGETVSVVRYLGIALAALGATLAVYAR